MPLVFFNWQWEGFIVTPWWTWISEGISPQLDILDWMSGNEDYRGLLRFVTLKAEQDREHCISSDLLSMTSTLWFFSDLLLSPPFAPKFKEATGIKYSWLLPRLHSLNQLWLLFTLLQKALIICSERHNIFILSYLFLSICDLSQLTLWVSWAEHTLISSLQGRRDEINLTWEKRLWTGQVPQQ